VGFLTRKVQTKERSMGKRGGHGKEGTNCSVRREAGGKPRNFFLFTRDTRKGGKREGRPKEGDVWKIEKKGEAKWDAKTRADARKR